MCGLVNIPSFSVEATLLRSSSSELRTQIQDFRADTARQPNDYLQAAGMRRRRNCKQTD